MLISRISGCKGNVFLWFYKTLLAFICLIYSIFTGYFTFMLALIK